MVDSRKQVSPSVTKASPLVMEVPHRLRGLRQSSTKPHSHWLCGLSFSTSAARMYTWSVPYSVCENPEMKGLFSDCGTAYHHPLGYCGLVGADSCLGRQ